MTLTSSSDLTSWYILFLALRLSSTGLSLELDNFACGDKQIFTFRKLSFAFTVVAALVHLIPGEKSMEFRIGFLVWYVTSNPILNSCDYLFRRVTIDHGRTFYLQQNMIMGCTTGLILFIPVMMGHLTKHLSLEYYTLKERVEL